MVDGKYWNLMSRYLSNELSLQETEELLEWLDEDPVRTSLLRELQDTWDKTRDYPVNFKVDTRAAWQNLKSNFKPEEREKKVSLLTPLRLAGIIASALIILFSGISAYHYYRKTHNKLFTAETPPGEHRQIVLPDGSKVWLNSSSSISYAENFSDGDLRKVTLKGEGFFDVTLNVERPFCVQAGKTVIRVSEALFNLRQDQAGSVKVSVLAGKVSILPEGSPGHELVLQAGEERLISKESHAGKSSL